MKKIISMVICLILVILCMTYFSTSTKKLGVDAADFLRIHIRANSDDQIDQNIKYVIKNEVVNYLTPFIAECNTKESALDCVINKKNQLSNFINQILIKNNFDYNCKVKICNEFFPTRSYDDVVLESGFYDAIIVELGNAEGANWWCVMYPPLCFSNFNNQNSLNIEYKSKILQIIKQFFN